MISAHIYNRLQESTGAIQRHFGQAPAPNPTLQAFFAAFLWDTGFLGVTTGDQAATLTGVSRTTADYARTMLENGDLSLVAAVMTKAKAEAMAWINAQPTPALREPVEAAQ